mmetsp:Transcript_18844/g.29552  ORF Transcript_18844/g.29552 Transcript_18844/m.29552 type:complete len:221 (+) Transcript_18844:2219-2881(+)
MWPSKGNSVCLRKKKPLKSRGGKSRKPCATSKKKKRKRSERREKRSKRRRKSDLRSSMNKLKDRGNVSKKSLKNKIALDRRVLELVVEPGSPGEQRQKRRKSLAQDQVATGAHELLKISPLPAVKAGGAGDRVPSRNNRSKSNQRLVVEPGSLVINPKGKAVMKGDGELLEIKREMIGETKAILGLVRILGDGRAFPSSSSSDLSNSKSDAVFSHLISAG